MIATRLPSSLQLNRSILGDPLASGLCVSVALLSLTALFTAALATVVTTPAQAYSITTASKSSKKIKRYTKSKVIYHLHPSGSDDMPAKTALDTLRKGFADWMAVDCGGLTFAEGYHCNLALKSCVFDSNTSCTKDTDCPASKNLKVMPIGYKNNGRNEMVFTEDSKWTLGKYVLGVTVAQHNYNGVILESDIAFNGLLQKWTNDPNKFGNGWSHLPSVAIHEQGHFFGVMHNLGGWSQDDPPTMTPNVHPYGIGATLSSDDKKAICFLNPKSSHTCKSDADCPYVVQRDSAGKEYYDAKFKCQSGSCVWGVVSGSGSKKLGDSCTSQSECAQPTFCQPVGGQSYCSQSCNPQTKNCPSNYTCYGYQGQPTNGACLKAPGSVTKKDIGESCAQSQECQSLLCLQGSCEAPCDPSKTSDCGSGEACQQISGGNGVCVKSTGPVLGGEGATCQDPSECGSGVCMKDDLEATVGYCRNTCTGPGTCAKDFKCVSQGEGYQGCLPGKENIEVGGVCTYSQQCKAGNCIFAGDAGHICSQDCTIGDAKSCPCGMACQNTGKGASCYPAKPLACLSGGVPCADGSECASTICANGTCKQTCNIIHGRDSCPAGEGCIRVSAGDAEGYCTAKGNVAKGKFCLGDELCVTLFCDKDATRNNETRCGLPCDPTAQTCAAGQKCSPLSAKIGACYVPEGGGDVDASGSDAALSGDALAADVGVGRGVPVAAANPGNTTSGCTAAGSGAPGSPVFWLFSLALAMVLRRRVPAVAALRKG